MKVVAFSMAARASRASASSAAERVAPSPNASRNAVAPRAARAERQGIVVSMMKNSGFCRSCDVRHRRRTEALLQLGKIKAPRQHRRTALIDDSPGRIRRPIARDKPTCAANRIVLAGRRLLHHEGLARAIPQHLLRTGPA